MGPAAWSIVERGAVYIHNNTPAPYAPHPSAHGCSRWEALTGTPADVSTMLGFVGQMGYTHRPGGKANAHRSSSDPVLCVCPSSALHAQLVFNLASLRLMVVGNVHLSIHPLACSLLMAGTALHLPFGIVKEPTKEEYTSKLNRLLNYQPFPSGLEDTMVVDHNPVDGLPTGIRPLVPALDLDGTYLLLEPSDLEPGPGETEASAPAGPVADAAASAGADAAAVPPGLVPAWTPTFRAWEHREAQALLKMAKAAGSDWPLSFSPTKHKRLGTASQLRFQAYRGATTLGEYRAAHLPVAGGTQWHDDLLNDLKKGLADIRPVPVAADIVAARVLLARRGPRHVTRPPRRPSPPAAPARPTSDHVPTPKSWAVLRASLDLIERFAEAEISGSPLPELRVTDGRHGAPRSSGVSRRVRSGGR